MRSNGPLPNSGKHKLAKCCCLAFSKGNFYMLKLFVWAENALYNLRNDLKGVTSMEYGVIAATTVVVVGGVVAPLGAPD